MSVCSFEKVFFLLHLVPSSPPPCMDEKVYEEGVRREVTLTLTPADAAHFLTWLAQRGTVQISSAKPYFSGINQFFKDLGLPGPCEGWLFNRAKSGLVNMQEEIEPSPHELPLPATVAKAIYDRACALGATSASAADNLALLRALLAVAMVTITRSFQGDR